MMIKKRAGTKFNQSTSQNRHPDPYLEDSMLEKNKKRRYFSDVVRLSGVAITAMVFAIGTAAAQDPTLAATQNAIGTPAIPLGRLFGAGLLFSPPASTGSRLRQGNDASLDELPGRAASKEGNPVGPDRIRRITLEQVKQQQFVSPANSSLARLAQLSIEAAKQHRLGAQADYFPKFGATVANLHYSEFLGQVISVSRPLSGSTTQVPVPLFSQNMTIAAVTFVQPITPLFQVYQAVRIARADERIAMAKAGVPVAKNTSDTQIEETYFRLLIAQRRLTSAEVKVKDPGNRPAYASTSIELVRAPGEEPELMEARKTLLTAGAEVRDLTASLDRTMGWPEDTELELVPPDPLVESISLEEVADKSSAANPEVIEAEQTVVKARAASVLSKLAYVPTVAAVAGFAYQNAIPLVPNNFGYGGVMVSYNIFDFGKRERAVKEASAQLGMAEIAVELTKTKIAANVKKAYFELERSRQLSQLAQKMGSSVASLMNVSSTSDSLDIKAARAKVETELLEADLAHRQAYARLKALVGPQRVNIDGR
jgi:outer membrane protein TolC